jgi:hypothetical protein
MEKWGKSDSHGKKTVWMKYPARMLTWRARTFAARDGFSDVLKGLKIYEEVADYTDMEDTNGKYEVVVPEAPGNPVDPFDSGFKQFCADIGFDDPGVKEFVELSAKTAGIEVQAILDAAYNNTVLFKEKLAAHIATGEVETESGQESGQNVQEEGETPFQEPDMDKVKEDLPDTLAKEEFMSTAHIELNDTMLKSLSKMKIDVKSKNYAVLLEEYTEYVVSTINANTSGQETPMDKERLIKSWLNDGEYDAFVEFFLSWIESEEMKENESAASEVKDGENTPVDNGASSDVSGGDGVKTSSSDHSPPDNQKTYISEWAMMPGPRFKKYVAEHPEHFGGISSDEYSKAREKWVKLIYAREKIDWPIEVETTQDEIKFPDMNPRQQLSAVRQKYPEHTKKAMEFRGFAQHVTTDECAQIVIDDVRTLSKGGVLVK